MNGWGIWWYRNASSDPNALLHALFPVLSPNFFFFLDSIFASDSILISLDSVGFAFALNEYCVCYLNISYLIENNWHFDQDFKLVMHFMLHQNEIKWFYTNFQLHHPIQFQFIFWIWKLKLNPNIPSVCILVSQFIGRIFAHIMSINSNWFFLFQCWKLVRLSFSFAHLKFAHVAGIFWLNFIFVLPRASGEEWEGGDQKYCDAAYILKFKK